jgi:hypothetical protein
MATSNQRQQYLRQENGLWPGTKRSPESPNIGTPNTSRLQSHVRSVSSISSRLEYDNGSRGRGKGSLQKRSNSRIVFQRGMEQDHTKNAATPNQREPATQTYKQASKLSPDERDTPRSLRSMDPTAQSLKRTTSSKPEIQKVELDFDHVGQTRAIRHMANPSRNTTSPVAQIHQDPSQFPTANPSHENSHQINQRDVDWRCIYQRNVEIWALRSTIHATRETLKQQQQVKSTAEDALVQEASVLQSGLSINLVETRTNQKSMPQLLQDSRDARDIYGPLEDDCTRLEDELTQKEFELRKLEEIFFGQYNALSSSIESQRLPELESPSVTANCFEEAESENSEGDEFLPVVNDFLSKTGDLELAKENLRDLVDEKEKLDDEKTSKKRFGLVLAPEDQEILDSFPADRDEIIEKIRSLELEVRSLKEECMSKGLVDNDGEPLVDFESRERVTLTGANVDCQGEMSEYVKYPTLLPVPAPELKPEELHKLIMKSDAEPDNPAGRVNFWLLHRLRSSALDVNLLASIFEAIHGKTSDQWEFSVLSLWFADATAATTSELPVYKSTLSPTTQIPIVPQHSDISASPSRLKGFQKGPSTL